MKAFLVAIGLLMSASPVAALGGDKALARAPIEVPSLPMGTAVKPVSLARMVVKMNRGQVWGSMQVGVLCIPGGTLSWRSGRIDVKNEEFDDVFREEMEKAGFKVEGDPNNLFEEARSSSEYAVAGFVKDIKAKLCFPYAGFGNFDDSKGSATIDVEWQIYSKLRKEIVAKVDTVGIYEQKKSTSNGFEGVIYNAFAENVKGLIVSDKFRGTFIGADKPSSDLVISPEQNPILLKSVSGSEARSISDAVGSVVAVFAGDSLGSGFLVSEDGFIITNHHVVGSAKYVKLRWADGLETFGEVVRSDKGRDVALIKAEPRGRTPLVSRGQSPDLGEAVFAIGTPFDQKFQSTISKGVISSKRTFDGYAYLQSDVAINPGNSGGPLLDEQGRLLGIAVAGYRVGNAPVDLNLFIPIKDAFDFLGIQAR
jgi:serine protease Do